MTTTLGTPVGTFNGVELFDGAGVVVAWRGGVLVGLTFASGTGWRVKPAGRDGFGLASRHSAVSWLIGRCADCVCDPKACAEVDSRDSCWGCGYCLNGCPENECEDKG